MKSQKQVRELLNLIERDDTYHVVILKDVGIEEIKTAKDILKWVLEDKS